MRSPAGGIAKAYIRTYRDSGQVTAYIEWAGGGRTEGDPKSTHMRALLARARGEGVKVTKETW